MLESVWSKGNTLGNVHRYSDCGKQHGSSLETKNKATVWSVNPVLGHIYIYKHGSKGQMHPNVYWHTFHKSQDMKAI